MKSGARSKLVLPQPSRKVISPAAQERAMDFATMLELAKAGLLKAEPVDEHFIEQEPPRSDGKEWFGSDPVSKFREQRKYFSGPPLSPEAHAALVA